MMVPFEFYSVRRIVFGCGGKGLLQLVKLFLELIPALFRCLQTLFRSLQPLLQPGILHREVFVFFGQGKSRFDAHRT